ncbi:MAG: FAD-dependent oxidoreductase, partial [Victivallales bacterium]|nr:FAD-dependent oxidoreductase [Victivallales bacterium]
VRYCVRYSPVCFAMAMLKFLEESGVDLLLDTIVSAPVMDGKHCRGVIIEGKSGREFIRGKMFVDVTGDGDLMRRAGMQVVVGENFETYMAKAITLESCRNAVESGDIGRAFELSFGGPADLYGHQQPSDQSLWHGVSTDETTEYLLRNQKCLLRKYEKASPNTYELLIPLMPQSRTSCRIAGEYVLRAEDAYRHFEDSVAAICDFDRRDFLYEVPYRTLIQKGYDYIATAGRCAAGAGYGWDVLRVIPPAIITGQAIGNAACLGLDSSCGFDSVDVQALQKRQASQNVMVHFDDILIPADAKGNGEYAPAFGHV